MPERACATCWEAPMPELTDEQLDERLRAAGRRWRERDTAAAPRTDQGVVPLLPQPSAPRGAGRGRWLAGVSAAAVAAAAVVIAVAVARPAGDSGNEAANQGSS